LYVLNNEQTEHSFSGGYTPGTLDAGGAITEWYVSAFGNDFGSSIRIISTVLRGRRCPRVRRISLEVTVEARPRAFEEMDFRL